jgi:aryl-alcohol dehydrogenase-like predicted oxidoreductase
MRYKLLGKSGLRVSELCLGTMGFGGGASWGSSKEESQRIFHTFADAGGNFIDTANTYTEGLSEIYLGEMLTPRRHGFVLATKYSLSVDANEVNSCGNHRKNMIQALEASLKRLRTDYIDLYWVHAWDFMTSVEEVMRALDDMVRAGKILYAGISDTPAWIVSQANTLASLRGWTPFVGLQIRYSLIDRAAERDLLPMAQAFDIGVTIWGALGGGLLSGKYLNNQSPNEPKRLAAGDPGLNERNLKISEEVKRVADRIDKTPSQVSLNWVRQSRACMIPIIAGRTVAQIEDNLGCVDFTLQEEFVRTLNEASGIDLGFPHDLLAADRFKKRLFGETLPLIDAGGIKGSPWL